MIETYCQKDFIGPGSAKRPDLLLSQDNRDRFLLIEFKRPSHPISREDIAQADQYRDDLYSRLSSSNRMEILMVGKGRATTLTTQHMNEPIAIKSYEALISAPVRNWTGSHRPFPDGRHGN